MSWRPQTSSPGCYQWKWNQTQVQYRAVSPWLWPQKDFRALSYRTLTSEVEGGLSIRDIWMGFWLWSHGLFSPWKSPGQNTGVGNLSLLPGLLSFQPRDRTQVSHIAGGYFTRWATREALCLMNKPQDDSQEINANCFQMQSLHENIIAQTKNMETVLNEKVPLSPQSPPHLLQIGSQLRKLLIHTYGLYLMEKEHL